MAGLVKNLPFFLLRGEYMRNFLDGLYRVSAFLSAASMMLIATIVAVQIGFRIANAVYFKVVGENLGWLVPSSAEFVGFLMVATSFMGLAYTLRKNGHIRVSILLNSVPKNLHRIFELICLGLGTLFTGYIFYHTVFFVLDSYVYDELSHGIVAVPLFIPQLFMLFGLLVVFIAFFDDFVSFIMGREVSYSLVASSEVGQGGVE